MKSTNLREIDAALGIKKAADVLADPAGPLWEQNVTPVQKQVEQGAKETTDAAGGMIIRRMFGPGDLNIK